MKQPECENLIVIPTYWAPSSLAGIKPDYDENEEVIYDHPTNLNSEGTLTRCLASLERIKGHCFDVLIVGSASTPEIQKEMAHCVRNLVRGMRDRLPGKVYLFTDNRIELCRNILRKLPAQAAQFMEVQGYSNVRNTMLILGSLLDAERIIMIDDDEYITDPDYLGKIVRALGTRVNGNVVDGLAGYYANPDFTWQIPESGKLWSAFWPKSTAINATYQKLLEQEIAGDLIETPMVFGGCMAMTKNLYRTIPFDRRVPRGEDIDYLINARMFGYNFYMHQKLSIVHDPPSKANSDWLRLRQDIIRFIYEKRKLVEQEPRPNMVRVNIDELGPYPAAFLGDDLMERFVRTTTFLAIDYLADGAHEDARKCLKNVSLAMETEKSPRNGFQDLLHLQKLWGQIHKAIADSENRQIQELMLE
ncbi:MAG: hypothetical protein J7J70_01420 [Deltaproteobacteria bacterium]|nr:hypothetical protein [Candidatus Tharpellaceae bacterium]